MAEAPPAKKPTMKMCCACPETKDSELEHSCFHTVGFVSKQRSIVRLAYEVHVGYFRRQGS